MLIVYDSLTGLGKKFSESFDYKSQPVKEKLSEKCILITRNVGAGKIREVNIAKGNFQFTF